MKIVSRFPYLWPQFNWGLAVGENNIDESDIPLAVHAKLEHLNKPGVPVPVHNAETGKIEMVPTPAPISGYQPSEAFLQATEKHNPKKAAARLPKVATLKTLATSAEPAPGPDKDDSEDDEGLDVELTEDSLGRLKFEDLRQVAAKLNVDVAGLQSKKQLTDRLLAHAAAESERG